MILIMAAFMAFFNAVAATVPSMHGLEKANETISRLLLAMHSDEFGPEIKIS